MPKPVLPTDAAGLAGLKRAIGFLSVKTQVVILHSFGIFGHDAMTLFAISERLKLSVGEVHRLRRVGLDDLAVLLGGERWP